MVLGGERRPPASTHDEAPQLYNVVEEMTIAAGLPSAGGLRHRRRRAQRLRHRPRPAARLGRGHDAGCSQRLDREELQGVIAHEMSHVRNYDIRFATLVGILVGMIALLADFFLRWSFWGGMGGAPASGSSAATRRPSW